ncbi:MAG TPA: YceI family protein [Candidatus Sulfotelmatobacter sp.]|nr:YceI family protein [Candidatus Sulfotelmatobacter sp.]
MTPQTQSRVQYAIDPKASQFTVQAFASGLISAVAHSPKIAIRRWTADVSFIPDSIADAKLKVVAVPSSFEVLDDLRESDRRELHRVMFDDVLEVRKFPEINFESSNVGVERIKDNLSRVNVEGRLSLHGVTNGQSFFSQVAFGVDSFRAYGEFSLLQSDYGIRIASIAGGTLKLQDELKFSFYVVGRKQEA